VTNTISINEAIATGVTVTDADHVRLREMLESLLQAVGRPYRGFVDRLRRELERARIVPAAEVDGDVVTMNSHLRVRDLDTGAAERLTLVFHGDADVFGGRLSVLSPLGTALIGQRAGDRIEWDAHGGGARRLRVERILYQPEAAGHFHL